MTRGYFTRIVCCRVKDNVTVHSTVRMANVYRERDNGRFGQLLDHTGSDIQRRVSIPRRRQMQLRSTP